MIYHVFANRSNAGDWLSARAIQKLIRPLNVTELYCDAPFVVDALRRLTSASANDLVIIGGGGLFMDYFDPFWDGFAPISERVPFVVWGAGLCELTESVCLPRSTQLRDTLGRSRLCIVRDERTRRLLHGAASEPPVPCPSLSAVKRPWLKRRGLLHAVHPEVLGAERQRAVAALVQPFATESGRRYRETHHRFAEGDSGALQKIVQDYARSDIVVSSRLHGRIMGVAMGRRVLAISGDRKVEEFMTAAGLEDAICELKEVDTLPARLRAISNQVWPRAFVLEARRQHRAIARRVADLVDQIGAA